MGRTWQMPPFACAPNTIPRGPAPRSRTALRAGGEARYRCLPVIVTPQYGAAAGDCGLVAVASGIGAELFAREGAEVTEQPKPANTIAASAQPRTLSRCSGDQRAMSPALSGVPSAQRLAIGPVTSSTGRRHAERAAIQAEYTPASELSTPSPE